MVPAKNRLKEIFAALNDRIQIINEQRRAEGSFAYPKSEITLLGQMSLLANEKVSATLSLAQTADLDALLKMDHEIKNELKTILSQAGLVYDEDSYLIWLPKDAVFSDLLKLSNVTVKTVDAESALVSKAVKAPAKNKQLIREAISSGRFESLVDRILANGGKLEDFA
jgi:hypothetical protein